jgi:hypothetical protein
MPLKVTIVIAFYVTFIINAAVVTFVRHVPANHHSRRPSEYSILYRGEIGIVGLAYH